MKNKFSFSKKMKSTALALSFVCGTAEEVMQVMNGNFSAIEGKFVDEEILK